MKTTNTLTKIIAIAIGLTIIPLSYAGLFDSVKEKQAIKEYKPEIPDYMKNMPYEKWQDTESGRFAHSLQYEDKLAKPIPYNFTKGKEYEKESIDYFEHLCKTEGKDYVYKTASNVKEVIQLRSFEIPYSKPQNPHWGPQSYKHHPYALEAPIFFNENLAGLLSPETLSLQSYEKISFSSIGGFYSIPYSKYQVKFNNNDIYSYNVDMVRKIEDVRNKKPIKDKDYESVEKLTKPSARYGFTWRGFNRPQDREYGIAGGDLIIIDLEKNEIMAIQRSFVKAIIQKGSPTNLNWEGVGCFEQYKNSDIYHDIVLEGKSFREKIKEINNSQPNTVISPNFLKKIISYK